MNLGQQKIATESSGQIPHSEQSLDEHLQSEQTEIAEQEAANSAAVEGASGADGEQAEGLEDGDESGEGDDASGEANEEAQDGEGDEGESDDGEPAYVPNTKYKVLDKEYEIDPKLHASLNAETEPIIRELYEKASGLDAVKASRDQFRTQAQETEATLQSFAGQVNEVMGLLKAGDLEGFFEQVKLSDDQIAQYILEKARIAQLTPEERSVYTERDLLRRRNANLSKEHQTASTEAQTTAANARMQALDIHLAAPEQAPLVKDFEARNGAGSFRKSVAEYARSVWYSEKKDLSPEEATQAFIKFAGLQMPTAAAPKPGTVDVSKRVVSKPKAKTIPNYGSSQASVTSQKPKNLDELKKYRKDKYGA